MTIIRYPEGKSSDFPIVMNTEITHKTSIYKYAEVLKFCQVAQAYSRIIRRAPDYICRELCHDRKKNDLINVPVCTSLF